MPIMLPRMLRDSRIPARPFNGYLCYRCEQSFLGSEIVHGTVCGEDVVLCKECAREART